MEDLKNKIRTAVWRQALAFVKEMPLEKISISGDRATFFYKNKCAFHVDKSSYSNSNSLFVNPEYEKGETKLLGKTVQPGWTVIDVGANFGWHAIHLSSLVGATGKVIAFEPVPESYRELKANILLNMTENIETLNVAVGNEAGEISMYVPNIEFGSGAASQFLDIGKKIHVPMVVLDEVFPADQLSRLDLIKIDIEGGELNVLKGAEHLLARFRPSILMEIVDVHACRFGISHEEIFQFLARQGYSGRFIDEDGGLSAVNSKQPLNGNYFFTV